MPNETSESKTTPPDNLIQLRKEGETITCNSPVPNMQWDENVVDPKAQFNIRGWVEDALKSKGAKITGKGCGLGGPDLDFELEGGKFNVQISFR